MTNKNTNENIKANNESKGWQGALQDAEAHLAEARRQLHEWQAAVRVCKKMIAAGEAWPGEASSEREA